MSHDVPEDMESTVPRLERILLQRSDSREFRVSPDLENPRGLKPAARRVITRIAVAGATLGTVFGLSGGCGTQPGVGSSADGTVLASVINVTPYEVSVLLSGVLDDAVDTVEETVGPSDSADVTFVCVDELVVGDPLEPTTAGITIYAGGQVEEVGLFSIPADEWFRCGDIIEIIISGTDPETFAVDVFALTPPCEPR